MQKKLHKNLLRVQDGKKKSAPASMQGSDIRHFEAFDQPFWTQDMLASVVSATRSSPPPTTTTTTSTVHQDTLHVDRAGAQHNANFEWMTREENSTGWRVERLRLRKTSFQGQSHNQKNTKSLHHFSSAASKGNEHSSRTNGELFWEEY